MTWVATAIGGAAVVGGIGAYMGSQASQNAANTQANAANNAAGLSYAEFQQQQANEQPYLQAGDGALSTLQQDMPSLNAAFTTQDFQQSPGYQWQLQQGLNAINSSSAARGLANSGGTMASLNNYAQGAANTDYQQAFNNYETQNSNTFNHLASVAGLGQTAVAGSNQAAQTAGSQIGGAITGAANAQAAGQVGSANAITGGLNTAVNGGMSGLMISNLMGNGTSGNYGSTMGGLAQNDAAISGASNSFTMPQIGSSAATPSTYDVAF